MRCKSGEKVPCSGIYRVDHDAHAPSHEVICIASHVFAACGTPCCVPSYTLLREAPYVAQAPHVGLAVRSDLLL